MFTRTLLQQLITEARRYRAEAVRRAGVGRTTMYRLIKVGLLDQPLDSIRARYCQRPSVRTKLSLHTALLTARLAAFPRLSAARIFAECRAYGLEFLARTLRSACCSGSPDVDEALRGPRGLVTAPRPNIDASPAPPLTPPMPRPEPARPTDVPCATTAPLVSIIIPYHNHARFVGEAIVSARAQSHPATEIVVVDDGSTDDSAAVVARHPEIHLVRQRNAGFPAARNTGLRVVFCITRGRVQRPGDFGRRIDAAILGEQLTALAGRPALTFVCGGNAFVKGVGEELIAMGVEAGTIRTERFGG